MIMLSARDGFGLFQECVHLRVFLELGSRFSFPLKNFRSPPTLSEHFYYLLTYILKKTVVVFLQRWFFVVPVRRFCYAADKAEMVFIAVTSRHAAYNVSVRTTASTAQLGWLPAFDFGLLQTYVVWLVADQLFSYSTLIYFSLSNPVEFGEHKSLSLLALTNKTGSIQSVIGLLG